MITTTLEPDLLVGRKGDTALVKGSTEAGSRFLRRVGVSRESTWIGPALAMSVELARALVSAAVSRGLVVK
jgi:hypothetical protein